SGCGSHLRNSATPRGLAATRFRLMHHAGTGEPCNSGFCCETASRLQLEVHSISMPRLNSGLVLLLLIGSVAAHTSAPLRLADYVGTYADAPDHTREIVDGDGLFAVVDEGKYPLRPSGVDRFTTMGGQTVRFLRDAHGEVIGYEQGGLSLSRVSASISS